jgi:hypothetical protein
MFRAFWGTLHDKVYRYSDIFFPRNVKFFPCTGNPPSAYKQLSSNSSCTGKNCRHGPKTFVYNRVANLGDFSSKKEIWGFLLKNVLGIF